MNARKQAQADQVWAEAKECIVMSLVPSMKLFTKQCQQEGYSRGEAIELTREYLRCMLTGNKGGKQ